MPPKKNWELGIRPKPATGKEYTTEYLWVPIYTTKDSAYSHQSDLQSLLGQDFEVGLIEQTGDC